MNKGKLIVFEGTDGSGKGTQIAMMSDYLKAQKIDHIVVDFPQYEETFFGAMVGQYLKGDFGQLGQVDPHLSALPYALDRWQAKTKIQSTIEAGKLVLANRYATASRGHLAANVPKDQRQSFLAWLRELEYNQLQIVREDLVLFLYVPPHIGQQLVLKKEQRSYLKGDKQDIHEQDSNHLAEAAKVFAQVAEEERWIKIDCTEGESIKSREEIHELIREVLEQEGVLLRIKNQESRGNRCRHCVV